ncbi:acanthoscurrin-1-like [Trichoplusia ni]|uniref:Acanthoscurrin-1-like n=1 Tax=Trichoplusia ni TaxID=7111 RepID=A0A7E5VDL5_TRINI|nr:acanthoscurrin-1-like [Trichoplusia ni]
MHVIWLTCLIAVFSQFGDCQVQWAQPMYQPKPRYYDCCSSAIEEINELLQVLRKFDEDRSCQPVQNPDKGSCLSEEIIMKLVNALIYTATQNCGSNGGSGGNGVGGGGGGGGNGLGGGLGGGLGLNLGLGGGLGGGLLGGSGSGGGSANGGGSPTGSGGGGKGLVAGSGGKNNGGLLTDVLDTVGDIL